MILLRLLKRFLRTIIRLVIGARDLLFTFLRGTRIEELLGKDCPVASDASLIRETGVRETGKRADKTGSRSQVRNEQILILIPCKNTAPFIPRLLANLTSLSYPADNISIGFLEDNSNDDTYALLRQAIPSLSKKFNSAELHQGKADDAHSARSQVLIRRRWRVSLQRERRTKIAVARNRLLRQCLKPQHTKVLWIDGDLIKWPADVIEQLLAYDKSILVPDCVNEQGRTFDLNSFKYITKQKFNWRSYIYDGLIQSPRGYGRRYLEDYSDYDLVPLDGVGGTMLLIDAKLHRRGLCFPEEPYYMHIETEGLAFMARKMGEECWGTPNIRVVHPSY